MVNQLKMNEIENEEIMRCRQTQCGFFLNGGCRACDDCHSESYEIKKSCKRCIECMTVPNRLRWDDKELEKEMNEAMKQQEQKGIILIYSNKPSPEHRRQEEELTR